MLKKYADIIIDISHEAIDRPFQYQIPDELVCNIEIGCQVVIPFGKGNSLRKGYVVGISDTCDYDENKMKTIVSVSDENLAIEGKLIALAAWIKEKYGSTTINALKTVMPVKQTVKPVVDKSVHLLCDKKNAVKFKAEYEKKRAKAKIRLLDELLSEQTIPINIVKKKLNISSQTLNAMIKERVIEISGIVSYRDAVSQKYDNADEIILNDEQQRIVDEFCHDCDNNVKKTYLLYGITGSGKTEVYVQTIKKVIEQGKQAIVLIPEISLTYQTVKYFRRYFGDRVTIMNSKLSSGERYDQFMKAKNGLVDVVVGPRSALFAPFARLGLIIIDEEHENTYKSDMPPKYHARETAIKRAKLEGASVILGSATPSVESYQRACAGKYRLWVLNKRAKAQGLAETTIVDLREELRHGNRSIISRELEKDIAYCLERKQQIMLFINKRGYNSFVSCRSCGQAVMCPHCDVSLTKHKDGRLICHYCGFSIMQPEICPACKSKLIGGYGTGTQKLEEEVRKLFPDAKLLRMDRDTTSKKNAHEAILESFGNGDADILIGTQMIVKGHDFSNVALVGIVLADLTLFNNDYRAGERTFDLITQAAGRAGRGEIPGRVVIQTYQPDNYAIVAAAKQDYEAFYKAEKLYRKFSKYPPFSNMLVILFTSENEELVNRLAKSAADAISEKYHHFTDMSVVGPAIPAVAKIKDIYRRVVYIKEFKYNNLVEIKNYIENSMESAKDLKADVMFDFNPVNLY